MISDNEIEEIARDEWERIRNQESNPPWEGLTEDQRKEDRAHVRRIAERVGESLAARDGTMTGEELAYAFQELEDSTDIYTGVMEKYREEDERHIHSIRQHVTAQGATVATLQAKVGELEKERDIRERRAKDAIRLSEQALAEKDRHISELEKSLETARKERDEQFKDFKARSDDYHRTISRMASERDRDFITIRDLKDELTRLKPSGRVAEDVALLETTLGLTDERRELGWGDVADALTRLATKAQGYEAAVADNAVFDAANQRMRNEVANLAHPARDRLVAACDALMTQPHPGAALLKEHQKQIADAKNDGLEEAAALFDALATKAESEWDPKDAELMRGYAAKIRARKTATTKPT